MKKAVGVNAGCATGESRRGRIPPEVQEIIADVLLAASCKDKDRPAYNEEQMDRKRRRASRAEEYFITLTAARYASRDLAAGGLQSRAARLAGDERIAWEMFSAGYRASEIARALRISRPTAVRLLKNAARAISTHGSALLGIKDVYHTEVHRRVYRKPTHCPEQPCRRLGYCKYSGRE